MKVIAASEIHGNAGLDDILGMAGKFFSDEKAFLFFRDRQAEYRLGDLEGLARGALGKLRDGNAQLLTKDQVIGLGLMAANEISLESSLNTRFIEYFNNPIIRLGGLMLGWPIAKMNQIHELMRNPETGRPNISIHRMMVTRKARLTFLIDHLAGK